ncbi:MAG TPA: retroviral-like aspartic protease family protein [Caulobacteraceae bacterium]|jgi:predicted aspartyl protease|nr:retroviral-like aspartic protease family protein [Caulobacteraceae bacterium]
MRAYAANATAESLPEAEFSPADGAADIGAMEDRFRRLTAPVMINGQGPFDFVVDTGANRSVISEELAARLQLPPGRPTMVHGITGVRAADTVKVATFNLGVRQASNLSIATLPLGPLRAAGLLGVDGLKNQRIVFDLPGSRLQILKSGAAPATPGGAVIPARRRFGQLTVVDTDLDGVRVSVLIDSGSESTVGNTALRNLVQRNRRSEQLQRVSLTGATGDSVIADYGAVPKFRLGSLTIDNLRVAYADLHPFALWDLTDKPALLMGMDVMRFFEEVALDYGRSEVRFLLPKTPYFDPAGDLRRS